MRVDYYLPSNLNYSFNGDYTLHPVNGTVHLVLNGEWQLQMVHPFDSIGNLIMEDGILSIDFPNGEEQKFAVTDIELINHNTIQVTAYPKFVVDTMNDVILRDVRPTQCTGAQALNHMLHGDTRFTVESDITKVSTAYYVNKNFIQALNGGDNQSFINRWGGEIYYQNDHLKVMNQIGSDKGIRCEAGLNMTGIEVRTNLNDMITSIIPVAYNGRTSPYEYQSSEALKYRTPKRRFVKYDHIKLAEDANDEDYMDDGVIVCENEQALWNALKSAVEDEFANGIDKPSRAYIINMADLSGMKEYEHLSQAWLGDVVHVYDKDLNLEITERVVELDYNFLTGEVESYTLAKVADSYFNQVSSIVDTVRQVVDEKTHSLIAEKVSGFINASNARLTAQRKSAEDADFEAMRIEVLDQSSQMYGCMVFGTQGIQLASKRNADNTDWDWGTAVTSEGIIADYIVTGILSDKTGNFYLNMNTGELVMGDGLFKGNITTNKDAKVGRWLYLDYDGNIDTSTFANYSRITLGHDKNTDPMPFVGFAKNNNGTESIVLATSSGQNGPLMSITKGQSSTALIQSSNGGTGIGVIDNQVQINNADAVFINTGDLIINGKTGLTGTFSNVTGFKVQNGLVYSVTGQRDA
jgi:phage minor structural protein